jgi:uncharacterized phage-like protein YoqJ
VICGITGQRRFDDQAPSLLLQRNIKDKLKKKFNELKATKIISGMALASDTLAVEVAIELKIPFIAALPFIGQEQYYSFYDKEKYHNLLTEAESVEIISKNGFANWKYQIRNQWIVDHCDVLIAIFQPTTTSGGTKNCIDYANKVKRNVIIIDPKAS